MMSIFSHIRSIRIEHNTPILGSNVDELLFEASQVEKRVVVVAYPIRLRLLKSVTNCIDPKFRFETEI